MRGRGAPTKVDVMTPGIRCRTSFLSLEQSATSFGFSVRGGAPNLTMYVVALGRLVPLRHWQCQPNGEPSRIEGVTRARATGHRRRPTTNGGRSQTGRRLRPSHLSRTIDATSELRTSRSSDAAFEAKCKEYVHVLCLIRSTAETRKMVRLP